MYFPHILRTNLNWEATGKSMSGSEGLVDILSDGGTPSPPSPMQTDPCSMTFS